MKKRSDSVTENTRLKCSKRKKRLGTSVLIFASCLVLVSGFFFAAQQHFSSMDYGMKNSRLRRQIDELEAEKRRLMLIREISFSPTEIKKAARKAGMLEPLKTDGDTVQLASVSKGKAIPTAVPASKSMVLKTAAVTAVPPVVTALYRKSERPAKETKKIVSTE